MSEKLRTVLVGFGKMGAGYAEDPLLAKYFPFASHAQVLSVHPSFSWEAVIDLSDEVLDIARSRWKIPYAVHNPEELVKHFSPAIAVIATPPGKRLEVLKKLPNIKAVIVEKPLGTSIAEGISFIDYCRQSNILVQVNLWRRADKTYRNFALGKLSELLGRIQAVFGIYGNGLYNNGTHMVDLVRMLFGEINEVQAVRGCSSYFAGPLENDSNPSFCLSLKDGITAMIQPVRFDYYRENGLDIWGEKARLSMLMEGLGVILYPRCVNRATMNEMEIASDKPTVIGSATGRALYDLYDNLASAIKGQDSLWSPGESALQTAKVIEAIIESSRYKGKPIELF